MQSSGKYKQCFSVESLKCVDMHLSQKMSHSPVIDFITLEVKGFTIGRYNDTSRHFNVIVSVEV